ncbi:MAG: fused MFS/spermidine synthase [Gammaproteobacteria bacterium]|nr:fused MFS/spermidine synthase [Gammaproteobacteria bacterium]
MLVAGFGGGATVEGVPPSVKSIDVVELEPEVIEANRSVSDERQIDPLTDPRVSVYINDVRSALELTTKKFDAIVSQPSHPWTAGSSHLYTREFMKLANSRLRDDGVYLQWMNVKFVDEGLLKALCATMLDVFDYVRVYRWDPQILFFLGSAEPLPIEVEMAKTEDPLRSNKTYYREQGIGSVEDVIAALAMDQENLVAFATGGRIITDDFNLMATQSSAVMDRGTGLTTDRLSALLEPFDPLIDMDSWLHSDFPAELEFTYISRQLEGMHQKRRAIALADTLLDLGNPEGLVMIALGQLRQNERQEAQRNLLRAINADPTDQQARYALLRPWLPSIMRGEQLPQQLRTELATISGAAAHTLRAWGGCPGKLGRVR